MITIKVIHDQYVAYTHEKAAIYRIRNLSLGFTRQIPNTLGYTVPLYLVICPKVN